MAGPTATRRRQAGGARNSSAVGWPNASYVSLRHPRRVSLALAGDETEEGRDDFRNHFEAVLPATLGQNQAFATRVCGAPDRGTREGPQLGGAHPDRAGDARLMRAAPPAVRDSALQSGCGARDRTSTSGTKTPLMLKRSGAARCFYAGLVPLGAAQCRSVWCANWCANNRRHGAAALGYSGPVIRPHPGLISHLLASTLDQPSRLACQGGAPPGSGGRARRAPGHIRRAWRCR
jgi:hypothetical protein